MIDGRALLGRAHHLAALEDAFAASRREAVTMLVHGPSGMGRSALLRRFLDDLVERQGALVLEGRSHPCPRGPHDALAPLVDALVSHLATLPADDVEPLIPPEIAALARLFPTLRRLPPVAAAPELADGPDPREVRRRAAAALRGLLGHLATSVPLVLALDDLHRADADSMALLYELVLPPAPPRLLLVAAYRSEDTASIGLVTALRRRMAHGDPVGDVRELLVGALAPREAMALARALLPADRAEDAEAQAIDRLSGGSPLLVRALARHPPAAAVNAPEEVLASSLAALPADARVLLEVIAAAGRPTRRAEVERAAAVGDPAAALALLRSEELVHVDAEGRVDVAQAQIREAALAGAEPGAPAGYHRALVDTDGDEAAPDLTLFHLEGAQQEARALAEIAARRAAEALAWGRAAAMIRRAVEGAPEPGALLVALGEALAHDGRSAEAGRAYLDAAATAKAAEARALLLRAFEALLAAGRVESGLSVGRDLLAAVGLGLPGTPSRAAASLLYRRARLSLRGLAFEERPGAASPEELLRVDVCGSVGERLHELDLVRGADFQARHLLGALEAGDPARVARALASAGIAAAEEGGRAGRERAALLVGEAARVAARVEAPRARAWAAAAQAAATFHQHRFVDAAVQAEGAVDLLRRTATGVGWEIGALVGRWLLPALHLLGRVDELVFLLPDWLDELARLGAHAEVSALRVRAVPRLLLARDQPTDARREAEDAAHEVRAWGAPVPRWDLAVAAATSSLYQGDGAFAHHDVLTSWPDLERSHLLRLESVRLEALHLRGASAVAAASPENDGRRLLTEAERDARALRREGCALGSALAGGLFAAVAMGRGQEDKALGLFGEAEAGFAALEMPLHEAAMRRRRGEIMRGEDGRALCREADGAMAARGVLRPDRLTGVLAPRPA